MVLLLLSIAAAIGPCRAADSRLTEFMSKVPAGELVPGADHYALPQGNPPVAKVLAGERLVGYAFVNADWVNSTGYSGQPIQILVGLTVDGKIAGARLMAHHEPIVLIGIPPERIAAFIQGYVGRDVLRLATGGPSERPPVDIVSGATVTVTVIAESMIRSGIKVARAEGVGGPAQAPAAALREIDPSHEAPADWTGLLGDGSVRRLSLTVGDVNAAFGRAGKQHAEDNPESPDPNDSFIDMYFAPVSVPAIGRRLLGDVRYADLQRSLKPGQQAILIASNGAYSFKGTGYVRGGIFDRIEVVQGDSSIHFHDRTHQRLGEIKAAGAPEFRDIDLFGVPEGSTLDVTQPWRLQLLVQRAFGARDKSFLTFDVNYELPQAYLKPAQASAAVAAAAAAPSIAPEPSEPPMWHIMWRAKMVQIGILLGALGLLTLIFFFQDWLVRRPIFYDRLRLGFMVFTLVWIGWYAQAQLSVVNVLAFLSALRTDFRWDYFLMAPLIFILWFATAASLLFWNRGAYCGWLCPFGALQELANRAARLLKIPQLKISFGVHQRLTALKYIVFLVLFGISLSALGTAEQAAEVEPFKTAIILRFARGWPFVLYAGAIIAASLFVERAFCRYVCPLGAAMAIPARLRLFDWLRRYRECGNPCQRCGNECPVQAIHPEGHINPNECIQCLHCQMLYHHDQKCPVMIQRRLKRERYAPASPIDLPPRPKISARAPDESAAP
ncbi:NosR/NirI family protein [Methylocella tundrae]|uniref:Regulatory protein NosR n=1 Tax=Methylocella tundrae TaxID=227605 RepID=A0A4U8Z6Q8_METTU|nr:NosR/NirI family protein [Methylocella tundrae]WPP04543.1 4Fe-4S binding protein [Methylocella tundrae]VFU10955.1 Regulatory protein NosR [Methylocella tundrae]